MSTTKTGLEADFYARFGLEAPAGFTAELAGLSLAPDATAALSRILARRSYRRFTDQPVPEAVRAVLLACAQSAPAKSDLQQYSILDLRDPAKKSALAELCDTAWMADAPVLLVFCGDLRRVQRACDIHGHAYQQNTLDSFMNAAVDAALAMQAMILAAEAAGLGCCCISQVRKRLPEVAELLNLPDGVFPVAGLAAGWPDEARDVTYRLPPSIVVHRDGYDDADLGSELDQYDQRRHAARPLANQIKPEKFGTAEFYGWSENAVRRLAEPSDLGGLRGYLEAHGFDLA
ncbi:MAG: nitroreductase family protein [Alphaproteobacteria bacterium]|nr:nitroreductase family protein [Alphaproteobacteria bacterium]